MTELLPIRTPRAAIDRDPGTLKLTLEDPGTKPLLATCSSAGGRSVVRALQETPLTATGVADRVDTSLQNVEYHLNRLQAADLIEVVATDVSIKGKEMDVFALSGDPNLVIVND